MTQSGIFAEDAGLFEQASTRVVSVIDVGDNCDVGLRDIVRTEDFYTGSGIH